MSESIHSRPIELLQNLIRFDTTNPPGNEAACIAYINGLLQDAGLSTTLLAKSAERPNLVVRLPGRGEAPALVLQGHVDVVTTADQVWSHPPFGAEIVDGYLWGRGALDMKSGVAMMIAAILRAAGEGFTPAGDIILTIMADEEAGSDFGARFLVEEHPEQFEGASYAIGEGGGIPIQIGPQRYVSIMVAEKQVCWMKARLYGPGGHGAHPLRGGSMARLGRLLTTLDERRLPVHITPVMESMVGVLSESLPSPLKETVGHLLTPATADSALDDLLAQGIVYARSLDALLHNTVNATVVRGGNKTNVIPSEIELELDGRLLPGYTPEELVAELHALLGDEVEFSLLRHDPGQGDPDLSLYPLLADLVRESGSGDIPIPTMVPGFTDGRMFARLGIQNYGFLPLNLPADFDFMPTVHNANERVPVAAFEYGVDLFYRLLQRYPGAGE